MATADQLKELTKKRGSFKGQLTNFINYLMELKQPLSSAIAKELQLRIGKIELLYDRFDEVQLLIECSVDEVHPQYAVRAEFDAHYYKALASAQEMLSAYSELPSGDAKSVSNRNLVKLPTIQLPKFNGSYENWLEFRDTFASLVHSNDDIDDINKYHYLRACLESSAAVVIQSTEFSASNYAVAWKMLCERYDNKRLLIQNHITTLFNIDTITKESSINLKRLIDQLKKNLRALEALGEPVDHWDTLLIYIITKKLDQRTYREWEEHKGRLEEENSNKFSDFIKFLRCRADLLETLELSHTNPTKSNPKFKSMVSIQQNNKSSVAHTDSPSKTCPKCKGDHLLSSCAQFLALSNEARLKLLPTFKVCFNCFKSGHYANHCKRPGCNICKRRHNSLIHVSNSTPVTNYHVQTENIHTPVNVTSSPSPPVSASHSGHTLSANVTSSEQLDVLLSTALVKLYDNNNREHVVRAVLDSGSTSCVMTESLFSKLNLKPHQIDRSILGINNVTSHVGKTCRVNMKSLDERFAFDFCCFVLPSITNNVPSREIDIKNLKLPSDICLADPTFYKPAAVDILLGADLFWDLLGSHKIDLGNKKPMLCETKLGWIISGPICSSHISLLSSEIRCHFAKMLDDHSCSKTECEIDLTRFWQLEEIPSLQLSNYSLEEKQCEEHFIKNISRLEDGRFCVRIPLKQDPHILGDSHKKATQCLLALERRLKTKPELYKMYHEFMSEYESLGHMSECHLLDSNQVGYYIPHHGVRRDQSTTTKLRVVFNASCPTTSGISLNDIQMVGPTVQDDLLAILLRFRQHKYILAADVEKMYRQILVHPSDRFLQQILWRNNANESIKLFQLNTVTYGTASAPFLATRCLKELGLKCNNNKVAEIIQHDFYVDDLLTGGDDLSEVMNIRDEVTAALTSAGMSLRKWQSNEPHLVSGGSKTPLDLNIGCHEASKLLGLGWYADSDELCFPIGLLLPKGNTKRDVLSAIAQIFDPLGLLAAGVVRMKILLQQLWLQKILWDEPLSPEINKRWNDIVRTLPSINNIRIPRIVVCNSYKVFQLHIFTDASELAYGACAYVRTVNDSGEVVVRLLSAKSRVAPIKSLSIPRLELCGALVGSRLYDKIISSLRVTINEVYIWTDSTIVLGWLQMHPSRLQPFVRNRVAEVLDKAGNCTWRHIPTELNPADLLSRGMDISSLQTSKLWWSGPNFLNQEPIRVPSQPKSVEMLPETKSIVSFTAVADSSEQVSFIDMSRFSNYLRLVRTVAYIYRWVDRCRRRTIPSSFLGDGELRNALNLLIRLSQIDSFPEYRTLLNNQSLGKKSPLLKFHVYLDEYSIMRVGGRIANSDYHYNKKHPILLQSTHVLTKLIFEFEHRKLMHAGPQLLLASIRETYWPIGGRNLAKACYRKCVRCSRMTGKTVVPMMGNLPRQRICSSGFPFENIGLDYAGPIMCASRQGRGCRLVKVYIAIFVCFSTKAIHLELVGGLTSNIFLMALNRFISRRGKPLNIYSDNGTSFVGAYNDIAKFIKQNCNSLGETTANDGITFHFIPAYSPHMGGLWEAGVKSTKYHLQRVLGNCNLSYEELNTTLTQIEAILNSRPLTPLSPDPADCTPLTPGHFIIGRPLTCLPQPDYTDRYLSHLTRFHRIEQLRQHFWARWSKEYISELQMRVKWRSCKGNLQLNTLVVVKEDHLPPLKWRLGRIVAVHPGSDGVVRVADIRTSTGVIRRSFSKICPLPVATESG